MDAYLYFDFAWLFSKDGAVRAFDIARYCEDQLNGESGVVAALFSNNQNLRSYQSTEGQEDEVLTSLLSNEAPIEVSASDVDGYSYIFQTKGVCRSILDVRFYNGRAFVGADNGIQQFVALGRDDLQDSQVGRSAVASLQDQRVSELPARQILGRYGAIAAACGPAGGLLGLGAGTEDRNWRITFESFAEKSYGIELNGNALSCLASATTVELYAVNRRAAPKRSANAFADDLRDSLELTQVTGRGFGSQDAQLNQLISNLSGAIRTFLFKDTLWVLAQDGFYRFRIAEHGEITKPHRAGMKAKPPARVFG
ncbi:hypothetical protein [Bradyrhizobium liaoningense]|uniref:hypothetical protein n=1 Tax=Bradyrhizobium liaoningense TaxID=43992 RepID=UPI001BA45D50|nr:hypothetical protein [Bradyrhizobium liaoningense]MBR0820287.1 hypothetical protein [Bradyrhizobium liaoningense]